MAGKKRPESFYDKIVGDKDVRFKRGVTEIIEKWQEKDRILREDNEGGYSGKYVMEQIKKEIEDFFNGRNS